MIGMLGALACGQETTTTLYGIEVIPHHYSPDLQRIDRAYLRVTDCLGIDALKEKDGFVVEVITHNRAFECESKQTAFSPDYCYSQYIHGGLVEKPLIKIGEPVEGLESMITYHFIGEDVMPCE